MTGPTIIVHTVEHARAALAAARDTGVAVVLESAPGAAAFLGAGVFREMIAAARKAVPEAESRAVLDCADAPGLALNALRLGLGAVRLDVPGEVLDKVADIAAQRGATLVTGSRGPALDLLDTGDPETACRDWLKRATLETS